MRFLLLLFSTVAIAAAQPKALFYMIETPNSVKSFTEHADKIDILVPAWYSVDGSGLVWGGPNPDVLKTAANHHVPVMPILALMRQLELHNLFTAEAAKTAFINALLSECKKNGYSGFQIDFENVNWTDRDLLSALVAETAAALHDCDRTQRARISWQESLFPLVVRELARLLRSESPGAERRSDLPHDLRPEHALDHARAGCRLSVDGAECRIRVAVRPQRETVDGNSCLRISLVRRRSRKR
jgi:hypothetical protein